MELGSSVRVVDVQPFIVDGSHLHVRFFALVENRSDKTIALRPQDESGMQTLKSGYYAVAGKIGEH